MDFDEKLAELESQRAVIETLLQSALERHKLAVDSASNNKKLEGRITNRVQQQLQNAEIAARERNRSALAEIDRALAVNRASEASTAVALEASKSALQQRITSQYASWKLTCQRRKGKKSEELEKQAVEAAQSVRALSALASREGDVNRQLQRATEMHKLSRFNALEKMKALHEVTRASSRPESSVRWGEGALGSMPSPGFVPERTGEGSEISTFTDIKTVTNDEPTTQKQVYPPDKTVVVPLTECATAVEEKPVVPRGSAAVSSLCAFVSQMHKVGNKTSANTAAMQSLFDWQSVVPSETALADLRRLGLDVVAGEPAGEGAAGHRWRFPQAWLQRVTLLIRNDDDTAFMAHDITVPVTRYSQMGDIVSAIEAQAMQKHITIVGGEAFSPTSTPATLIFTQRHSKLIRDVVSLCERNGNAAGGDAATQLGACLASHMTCGMICKQKQNIDMDVVKVYELFDAAVEPVYSQLWAHMKGRIATDIANSIKPDLVVNQIPENSDVTADEAELWGSDIFVVPTKATNIASISTAPRVAKPMEQSQVAVHPPAAPSRVVDLTQTFNLEPAAAVATVLSSHTEAAPPAVPATTIASPPANSVTPTKVSYMNQAESVPATLVHRTEATAPVSRHDATTLPFSSAQTTPQTESPTRSIPSSPAEAAPIEIATTSPSHITAAPAAYPQQDLSPMHSASMEAIKHTVDTPNPAVQAPSSVEVKQSPTEPEASAATQKERQMSGGIAPSDDDAVDNAPRQQSATDTEPVPVAVAAVELATSEPAEGDADLSEFDTGFGGVLGLFGAPRMSMSKPKKSGSSSSTGSGPSARPSAPVPAKPQRKGLTGFGGFLIDEPEPEVAKMQPNAAPAQPKPAAASNRQPSRALAFPATSAADEFELDF